MSATASHTLIYLAVVLVALATLMAGVRSLQQRERVGAEAARKLVHVGMGLICLPLPWWFARVAPVLVLAAAATLVLLVVRYHPTANRRFGSVLGATGRASFGEFFYPAGVLAALLLCGADRVAYCSAVGVLTFGDMAGAMVGQRYGRWLYGVGGNRKSVEGSLAVLGVSFVWIAGAVAVMAHGHGTQLLLGSWSIAAAATALEAVSRRGFDNLLLPIGTAALMLAWRHPATPTALVRAVELGVGAIALGFCFLSAVAIVRLRTRGAAATAE